MVTRPGWFRVHGIARALGNPNFRIYTAGHSVSLIGSWMQRIAVGWLAWELTESGAWLGGLAFANLIPSVFIGPIAGAIADRTNRLRIVTVAQSLAMAQAFALFGLTASGLIGIESLLGLVLFQGCVQGFNQPSNKALIASLVPRDDLPNAVAINSIIVNLARFIGPAVAAVLIVASGVAAAFAVNALSFLAFLVALARIRLDPEETFVSRAGKGTLTEQIIEGVRYAAGHPGIGPILLLYLAYAACARPLIELLPGFAAEVFDRGAGALAMLTSALGVGAVAAGLVLAQRGDVRGLTRTTLLSVLGLAFAIVAFVASDNFHAAIAAITVVGFCMVSIGVGSQTLVQLSVAPSMRGRVLGLHGILFRGGAGLGALLIGLGSEWVGLRWSFAGAMAVLLMAWLWALRRRAPIAVSLEGAPAATKP
jgi:MFS family permease